MEVAVHLTGADIRAAMQAGMRKVMRDNPGVMLQILAIYFVAIAAALFALLSITGSAPGDPFGVAGFETGGPELSTIIAALVVVGLCAVAALYMRRRFVGLIYPPDSPVLGEHVIRIEAGGVRVTGNHLETLYRWSALQSPLDAPKHVFLPLGGSLMVIVPKSGFDSDADRFAFLAAITEGKAQAERASAIAGD